MQASVPELTDISKEPLQLLEMYGPDVHKPGTYAANCLLARRLSERGVRFVQLFHMGWDQHGKLPRDIRPVPTTPISRAPRLMKDLKQRGLLDETLVVWGGEFGRTVYSQGDLTDDQLRPRPPSSVLHGLDGGCAASSGAAHRQDRRLLLQHRSRTPCSVHDLHATMLHLMGIDHKRLTYRFQGRDFRLTDVFGDVVQGILA